MRFGAYTSIVLLAVLLSQPTIGATSTACGGDNYSESQTISVRIGGLRLNLHPEQIKHPYKETAAYESFEYIRFDLGPSLNPQTCNHFLEATAFVQIDPDLALYKSKVLDWFAFVQQKGIRISPSETVPFELLPEHQTYRVDQKFTGEIDGSFIYDSLITRAPRAYLVTAVGTGRDFITYSIATSIDIGGTSVYLLLILDKTEILKQEDLKLVDVVRSMFRESD